MDETRTVELGHGLTLEYDSDGIHCRAPWLLCFDDAPVSPSGTVACLPLPGEDG